MWQEYNDFEEAQKMSKETAYNSAKDYKELKANVESVEQGREITELFANEDDFKFCKEVVEKTTKDIVPVQKYKQTDPLFQPMSTEPPDVIE